MDAIFVQSTLISPGPAMCARPGRNRARSVFVARLSGGGEAEVSTSAPSEATCRILDDGEMSVMRNSAEDGPGASAPLVEAVVRRAGRQHELPFHVPGHKRGSRLRPAQRAFMDQSCWQCDTTELSGLDNLQDPDGVIQQAASLASELWNCDHTWFLVNGATTGIQATIMSTCPDPNDCVIMARNAHQSAFHGAVLAGCRVRYIVPVCGDGFAHHVTVEALEEAFMCARDEENVRVRAVLVVSPTYYGVQSDLAGLKAVCDRHGALLIVDEAHGAHLDFLGPNEDEDEGKSACEGEVASTRRGRAARRRSALGAGAALVVQSTHKQLGALTQSAMLHAQGIDTALQKRIDRVLRMLQSSSPSYLLMASLDASRAALAAAIASGDDAYVGEPHAASMRIREYFHGFEGGRIECMNGMTLRLLAVDDAYAMDPWRLTIVIDHGQPDAAEGKRRKPTGWSIASLLESSRGVVAEMATQNAVVFACSIGTTMEHADGLVSALDWLSSYVDVDGALQYCYSEDGRHASDIGEYDTGVHDPNHLDGRINGDQRQPSTCPRDAYIASPSSVPIALATHRIAAETITVYPPGIPIVCVGDTLTKDILSQLVALKTTGASITGAADPTMDTILVVPST